MSGIHLLEGYQLTSKKSCSSSTSTIGSGSGSTSVLSEICLNILFTAIMPAAPVISTFKKLHQRGRPGQTATPGSVVQVMVELLSNQKIVDIGRGVLLCQF